MAATSEMDRGGATRLAGALLVRAGSAARTGSRGKTLSASNSAAFGRDAIMALLTQALTFGPALARQDPRFPPPPPMQAMTIGLPTVLRQCSIAWLSSKAAAGWMPRNKKAAMPNRTIAVMRKLHDTAVPILRATIGLLLLGAMSWERGQFAADGSNRAFFGGPLSRKIVLPKVHLSARCDPLHI